jgi:hypothetical protein
MFLFYVCRVGVLYCIIIQVCFCFMFAEQVSCTVQSFKYVFVLCLQSWCSVLYNHSSVFLFYVCRVGVLYCIIIQVCFCFMFAEQVSCTVQSFKYVFVLCLQSWCPVLYNHSSMFLFYVCRVGVLYCFAGGGELPSLSLSLHDLPSPPAAPTHGTRFLLQVLYNALAQVKKT